MRKVSFSAFHDLWVQCRLKSPIFSDGTCYAANIQIPISPACVRVMKTLYACYLKQLQSPKTSTGTRHNWRTTNGTINRKRLTEPSSDYCAGCYRGVTAGAGLSRTGLNGVAAAATDAAFACWPARLPYRSSTIKAMSVKPRRAKQAAQWKNWL